MSNIKNIIEYTPQNDKKLSFEQNLISIKGQPDSYDFSMVIAVYNSEKFVGETIESIINQDYDFEKIQIVLVNDGSKDGSFDVCKKYAEQYPKNIVLVSKPNGGVSSARNVGMLFAKGKYLNFIDSDDLFESNVCAKVAGFFETYQNKTDVVTIKNELFGAKTGGTWFNEKFKKGDRLIDLWKEPKVYLNSVSFTFFHSRIKNQLVFDENISISEDLKVVNYVLMNKWTLGVLDSCRYFYRMHPSDVASLSSSARRKPDWYFTYLNRVYFWLYERAFAKTSCFPPFLQHTLYRDLYNRFVENVDCEKVLKTKEEQVEYKKLLFKALSLVDDNVIKGVNCINTDYQIYFYSIKHGKPEIVVDGDSVHFVWEEQNIDISKRLCVMYENCQVKNKNVILEGYFVYNNTGIKFADNDFMFNVGEKDIKPEIIKHSTKGKLAFLDEFIFTRKHFKLTIPFDLLKNTKIIPYIKKGSLNMPCTYNGACRWFCVNDATPHSYCYNKGLLFRFDNRMLTIKKSNWFKKIKCELSYLNHLRKKGKTDPEFKHTFKVRAFYDLIKPFKFRKIWLVSDREISGGDNGECFYEFLKSKRNINKYFVLFKNTPDWERLKKQGFKLVDPFSRKYKCLFILSDAIVSSHLETRQIMPVPTTYYADIISKKKYIFLQHGIIKDDLSDVYTRSNYKMEMFVTSAVPEYNSIVKNPNYFCDDTITQLTGLPRFDKLHNDEKKIVLVMPTWRRYLASHMDPVKGQWVFKSNFEKTYFYKFYRDLLTNKKLKEYLDSKGYKLVYFPHTNTLPALHYFEDIEGVEILKGKDRNYNKVFAEANIMVTDYSSTAFDFGYLRKPIIFCQGDKEEFFAGHTYSQGYFDYERDAFGKVTYNLDDAVEAIIKTVENNCKPDKKYLDRINNFFPFTDKNNCLRVYKKIRKIEKD